MSRTPRRAGIIGWPVAHSRSPLIHGYWLKKYGIDGTYTKCPVRPGDVAEFLRNLRDQGLVGCNVTIPHKEVAYAVATNRTAAACAVAAANTLWLEGDQLCADNTDGIGFQRHLLSSVPSFDPRGKAVSMLGAGGAARCVINAMLEIGAAEVRVFNRTRQRADAVAEHFGSRVRAYDWEQRADRSREVSLLVNATSLGMAGHDPLEIGVAALRQDCIVADLVYVPLETPLLAQARARALSTVDGLGMLLHQATPGFEKWFGVKPEVTAELRALVVADIEGR